MFVYFFIPLICNERLFIIHKTRSQLRGRGVIQMSTLYYNSCLAKVTTKGGAKNSKKWLRDLCMIPKSKLMQLFSGSETKRKKIYNSTLPASKECKPVCHKIWEKQKYLDRYISTYLISNFLILAILAVILFSGLPTSLS